MPQKIANFFSVFIISFHVFVKSKKLSLERAVQSFIKVQSQQLIETGWQPFIYRHLTFMLAGGIAMQLTLSRPEI